MATKLPYKLAEIYRAPGAGEWYVYFFYLDPATGKYKRFKERFGLNNMRHLQQLAAQYGKTVETVRETMAQEMVKIINDELKKGLNPFAEKMPVATHAPDLLLPTLETLVADLCKPATTNTAETYRLMLSRFKKYVEKNEMENMPLASCQLEHAENFQTFMQLEMGLAKKTINATISHMGLFFDELRRKIKENPFRLVKPLTDKDFAGLSATNYADIYEPLTSIELDAILQELKRQNQHGFVTFLAFIYYAWMRPVEITRLKVNQIDIAAGIIRTKKPNTKNKSGGMVQIVPPLLALIKKMDLHKCRPDHFLFSKGFKPGPTALDASRGVGYLHWNPICKSLGIDKKMYALKHSGNIEYLLANRNNVNIKWQQMQNRHKTAAQTENYNRKLGAFFIDVGKVKFRKF